MNVTLKWWIQTALILFAAVMVDQYGLVGISLSC
jgi:hypothetical protein